MYDFVGDYETFYTGETDPRMSGLYDTFLGSKNLKQWNEDHCSNIHGASDGTKFKSFVQPDEQLLFFRKSMCRPQRMVSLRFFSIFFFSFAFAIYNCYGAWRIAPTHTYVTLACNGKSTHKISTTAEFIQSISRSIEIVLKLFLCKYATDDKSKTRKREPLNCKTSDFARSTKYFSFRRTNQQR